MKSGNIGELAAMLEFAKRGYEIYSPTDNGTFDFIAHKDDELKKVEVKSCAAPMKGSTRYGVTIKATRSNKTSNRIIPFDKTKVDYLVIYLNDVDKLFIMDSDKVVQTAQIQINLDDLSNIENALCII